MSYFDPLQPAGASYSTACNPLSGITPGSSNAAGDKSIEEGSAAAVNDTVCLAGKTRQRFALTQAQVNEILTTTAQDLVSGTVWKYDRPAVTKVDYGCIVPASDGSLFVDKKDSICRVNAATGKEEWSSSPGSELIYKRQSMWQAGDGTVLLASQDNRIHALDPAAGKEKWSFDLEALFQFPVYPASDGTVLVFRKKGDSLHLTRLNADGTIKNTARLGYWDEPIAKEGNCAQVTCMEDNGDVIVHAHVRETPPGTTGPSLHVRDFRISSSGKVLWETDSSFDPSATFPTDGEHIYAVDYDRMKILDKNTGREIWQREKKHEFNTPEHGPHGDTRFEFAGEHKFKYLRFVESFNGRLIMQAYCDGPLRITRSGEELLCMDSANPDIIFWRKDVAGSIFNGPLYADREVIVHASEGEPGAVEAIDPLSGQLKWKRDFREKGEEENTSEKYLVKRGSEGTLFIRTVGNIYGVDSGTGEIKYAVKTKDRLDAFFADEGARTIVAVNADTRALQAYDITVGDGYLSQAAGRIEKMTDTGSPERIEVQEEFVNVGGVCLKRNAHLPAFFRPAGTRGK